MNSSPCAKFTTSMIPKISVSPEATRARIIPFTMPLMACTTIWSQGIMACLHSQVLVDDGLVGAQGRRRRLVPHHALLHDVDALAHAERERHVLLDQQDG